MISNDGGAIISEYYPTFEPLKFRFPQRNRIVSGLSYGTLVVEAALKSGALITANLTLEQGRELLCIPGLITNPNTEGIYKLIKTGATIVTESSDILNALNWTLGVQQTLFDTENIENIEELASICTTSLHSIISANGKENEKKIIKNTIEFFMKNVYGHISELSNNMSQDNNVIIP